MEHSREAPPGLRGTSEAGFITQWVLQSLGEPEDVSNAQRTGAAGWGSQDGGQGLCRATLELGDGGWRENSLSASELSLRPVPLGGRAGGRLCLPLGSPGGRAAGQRQDRGAPGRLAAPGLPGTAPAPTCPETQAAAPDSVALGTRPAGTCRSPSVLPP